MFFNDKETTKIGEEEKRGIIGCSVIAIVTMIVLLFVHFNNDKFTIEWFIACAFAVISAMGVICFRLFVTGTRRLTEEELNSFNFNIGSAWAVLWLIDLFYISYKSLWNASLYISGFIIIIFMSFNLAKGVTSPREKQDLNVFFACLDFAVVVIVTIFMLQKITFESTRNIVTTIVAAVYGGLVTLVGVAWTIQNGERVRKEAIEREKETEKEIEKKRCIPYLALTGANTNILYAQIPAVKLLTDEEQKNLGNMPNDRICYIRIDDFYLQNVSERPIILSGVELNGKYFPLSQRLLIANGQVRCFGTLGQYILSLEEINDFKLKVEDVLSNVYFINVSLSDGVANSDWRECKKNNGAKFYTCHITQTVEDVSLPLPVDCDLDK